MVGLGSSEATAVIELEKKTYQAGEEMVVKVDMNNSKCKKPVQNIQVKLMRNVSGLAQGRKVWDMEEEVDQTQFPGCAEKVTEMKVLRFPIRSFEKNLGAS